LQEKIDLVVLELGANDGLRGIKVEDTEKNLVRAVEYLQSKKIKVLMLGILLPPNYGKEYTQKFKKMYEGISKNKKIPLFPFVLEGVAGKKELNQADGIHPNAKGHEIIARNLVIFIEENL
jgi:acyl-CoA thioesterase-1